MSPDGAHVAVVLRLDGGGAAGTRSYVVNVEGSGDEEGLSATVLRAAQCETLIPTWQDNSTLIVSYGSGCLISSFENHWYAPRTRGESRIPAPTIEIILVRVEDDVRSSA